MAQTNKENSKLPGRGGSRWMRWLVRLGAGLVFLVVLCLFRAPILGQAAEWWMVNEPKTKADAIVVLGGGANFRSFEAARLYQQGLAPRVLVMNSELRALDRQGFTMPECEMVRRVLLTNGVPSSAVAFLGNELTSTYEEAVTLRDWARTNQVRQVLIPTNPFHTRRVRWFFHKVLRHSDLQITVTAIEPEKARNWWRKEATLIDFQNELIKFAFYLVKY